MASNSGDTPSPRATICVYCGSSPGYSHAHMDAARRLAEIMAQRKIKLVYGGGTVGLMGEIAKTIVARAGPNAVHGIIPEDLLKYECDDMSPSVKRGGISIPDPQVYGHTTVVEDMHTRKSMMAKEVFSGGPGSGFIALSGGFGTVEEVLEVATWAQLGIHKQGVSLVNVNGFFDGLLQYIRRASAEGFIHGKNAKILHSAPTAEAAVDYLLHYKVPDSVLGIEWKTTVISLRDCRSLQRVAPNGMSRN